MGDAEIPNNCEQSPSQGNVLLPGRGISSSRIVYSGENIQGHNDVAANGASHLNDTQSFYDNLKVVSKACSWTKHQQRSISQQRGQIKGNNVTSGHSPAAENQSEIDIKHLGSLGTAGTCMATTVIHASWALVVARMTNSNCAAFNIHLVKRHPEADADDSPSQAIAPIPVKIELSYSEKTSSYLKFVQKQTMNIQSNEYSQARDTSSRNPEVDLQTLLIVQLHDSGIECTTLREIKECRLFETFDLVLQAHVLEDDIIISAHFDSRAITPPLVHAYLNRLEHVMSQLFSSHDDQILSEIETVMPSELRQIWEWNGSLPTSVERCVHDVFEDKARLQPTSVAVCAWDGDLTYGKLSQLSSALAARLVKHGVGHDVLVPLCFDKSMWTTVAILGVLKAGGAFTLLDPSLPEERLRLIIQQLKPKVIVCSDSKRGLSWRLADVTASVVTVNWDSLSNLDVGGARQICMTSPSSICYVVFTSGSTGTPKGVVITHANAASALHHHVGRLGLTTETRIFDFASYSTDVAISNLFTVLAAGGCLCVPNEADRSNSPEQSIVDLRANTVDITPSVARLLSPANIPGVNLIIFGGEALRLADVERWWGHGQVRIIHEYGPSECTQNSTMNCNASTSEEVLRIGIGAGQVTWVVDPENVDVLLPLGCIGELLLEGPLVGRGYLNDPDKTAAAFVEDPVWLLRGVPGRRRGRRGRLYKTGDLVRYNDDGSLAFVSRKDGQAKVRGQRVELGEVEHWVRACMPDSIHVVAEVIVPRAERASPTLVAFLQDDGNASEANNMKRTEVSIARLSAKVEGELARHLPGYMIPTAFFFMEELPTTATGKMDRKRLREIGASFSIEQIAESRTTVAGAKRQPTSEIEHRMQNIWSRVLGIEPSNIGVSDDFFHLGGDSIAAMRVVAEARNAGLIMVVSDLFLHRQLHQVATHTGTAASLAIPHILPCVDSGPFRQSFAQEGLWRLEQRHPGLPWHLKPSAIRLKGPLVIPALNAALDALELRHEVLRTTFISHDDSNVQEVQPFQSKVRNVVDASAAAEDDHALLVAMQTEQSTSFNLQTEPGWRVSIYRLDVNHHVLSIVMHHIIADTWSVGIIGRELATLYSAAARGEDPFAALKPLPIQFHDYTLWQRQSRQLNEQDAQLSYWRKHLSGSQPAELPGEKPRPTTPSGLADVQEFRIEGPLYDRVQAFCNEEKVTPFAVLLAAFRATHYLLTGAADATIGTPCANRERPELREMVGLLVNILCIRITVGDESFGDLVQQVQASTVASLANQDVPFARVASALSNEADSSRHPLVQMIFALNSNMHLGELYLEGVDSQPLATPLTTRFDLEFLLCPSEDGFDGQVIFSLDLYQRGIICNMISVFRSVLELGLDEPQQTISSLHSQRRPLRS